MVKTPLSRLGELPDEHILRELAAGENVLWSGRPATGLRFQRSDLPMLLFALFWTGLAVVLEATAFASDAPWFTRTFASPFVLIGIYMSVGRFFVDAALRSRTAYGLTDRRALIVSWLFVSWVRSINLRALQEMNLLRHRNGMGSIVFGTKTWATRSAPRSPRFEWIREAEPVYQLALEAQAQTVDG